MPTSHFRPLLGFALVTLLPACLSTPATQPSSQPASVAALQSQAAANNPAAMYQLAVAYQSGVLTPPRPRPRPQLA